MWTEWIYYILFLCDMDIHRELCTFEYVFGSFTGLIHAMRGRIGGRGGPNEGD